MFPVHTASEVEGPWPKMAENLRLWVPWEIPRHLESHLLAFCWRFWGTYQRVPWMPSFLARLGGRNHHGKMIILCSLPGWGWMREEHIYPIFESNLIESIFLVLMIMDIQYILIT